MTRIFILSVVLISFVGCAGKLAPVISPTQAQRAVTALTLLKDTADAAYADHFISQQADTVIAKSVAIGISEAQSAPSGWVALVKQTLANIDAQLSPAEQTKLDPYISVVDLILDDVIQ